MCLCRLLEVFFCIGLLFPLASIPTWNSVDLHWSRLRLSCLSYTVRSACTGLENIYKVHDADPYFDSLLSNETKKKPLGAPLRIRIILHVQFISCDGLLWRQEGAEEVSRLEAAIKRNYAMDFRFDRGNVFTYFWQVFKNGRFLGQDRVFADVDEETREIRDLVDSNPIVFNVIEAHVHKSFPLQCRPKLALAAEKLSDLLHSLILILLLDFAHALPPRASEIGFIEPVLIAHFWEGSLI